MGDKVIHTFEDARDYVLSIPKFSSKNAIEDTEKFYESLGKPGQRSKIIHVAGTNGKGSVCAYLNGILLESGSTTGVFTSPHLVTICERIRFGNRIITEEEFLEAFFVIKNAISSLHDDKSLYINREYHPSFFEWIFLMAMIMFDKNPVDYIILETGLGGRLDATNVIGEKQISIISKISLDHMEYLGDTLEQIAYEKAGIIKQGVPVVYLQSDKKVSKVIEDTAKNNGSLCYFVGKEDISLTKINKKTIDFSVKSRYYDYISLTVSTVALYQMENVALALLAIDLLDKEKKITEDQKYCGISNVKWEGRMEEISPDIFVDGAHNVDGIDAFIQTVQSKKDGNKNHLLFSVVKDKQYDKMIHLLIKSNLFIDITVTTISGSRQVPIDQLERIFSLYDKQPVYYYEDARKAYEFCRINKGAEDRLFIVGSLYLVGLIKTFMEEEKPD